MKNKCIVCNKEFEALRKSKTTCSDSCRQKLARGKVIVTKIVPIVTKKEVIVTKEKDTVTEKVIVTEVDRSGEKELKFDKDTPMEERLKRYKEMYTNSAFVPNWVAHGFNSKEDAIKAALRAVQKNEGVVNLGLGND